MTHVTNIFFKKEEHRRQKKTFSQRMKTLRREPKHFHGKFFPGILLAFRILGKIRCPFYT